MTPFQDGGPGKAGEMPITERISQSRALDALVDRVRRPVTRLLRGRVRQVLGGRGLGHPLHPALIHLPVGCWTSAAVLELAGRRGGTTVLTAVGVAGAVPAALTGWNDWQSLSRPQQRLGVVHAASNVVAATLYAGSLAAGRRTRAGRALAWAGFAAAGTGAFLGGHLAYQGRDLGQPHPAAEQAQRHAVSHS